MSFSTPTTRSWTATSKKAIASGYTSPPPAPSAAGSMKSRPRIELNPAQPGLNAAFAGLSMPDLPSGPEAAPTAPAAPAKRRRVVLHRETAHRGGKAVIVVHDFASHISAEEIASVAKRLRGAI